jgi:hypothetical protein
MSSSENRSALIQAQEKQKVEEQRSDHKESLNSGLNKARFENSTMPEKGFFGRMMGGVKNAMDGWRGKYNPASESTKPIENNHGYDSSDRQQRQKITIKNAKEANSTQHSGKEIVSMVAQLGEQIRIEQSELEKLRENIINNNQSDKGIVEKANRSQEKIFQLQNQLGKWKGMQTKIYESLSDDNNPNTKRHNRVLEEIKLQKESLAVKIGNEYSIIEKNGELSDSELERFSNWRERKNVELTKKSDDKIAESVGQTTIETVNFPVNSEKDSILTREVFEKYKNLSILELGSIINSTRNEKQIKEIQSVILYKNRNPFVNQAKNSEDNFSFRSNGERVMQGNFDESDYERYARANNIPFKSQNIAQPNKIVISPTQPAEQRKSTKIKQVDIKNTSLLNRSVSTLLTEVGEIASINFEKAGNVFNLLLGKEKIPETITPQYVSSLIKKFESASFSDSQGILKQLEKKGKLEELASKCTEEQLESIRTYANDYQAQKLQNYDNYTS